MAAYISVPRDLTKVKSKVAFNLTKRQLICFGAAAVVGVPLFFVLRDAAGNTGATLGMMAVMLPAFFLGMYLFSKVRSGKVRILLGSTAKMGAGTNVQTLLVAVHHLDVGWRPSDMTQRNGRIIRQGNQNKRVFVYNYVTEGTFDAYLWVRHEVA